MFDPADYETRHPATVHLLRWFEFEHLTGLPREVSEVFQQQAYRVVEQLEDGPELTAGLRKLLEAKDCFVRAAVNA